MSLLGASADSCCCLPFAARVTVRSLSAADRARTLLLPDGGHYCGDVQNERPHGLGISWRPDGELNLCGSWADGELEDEERAVPLSKIPAAVIEGKKCECRTAPPCHSLPFDWLTASSSIPH